MFAYDNKKEPHRTIRLFLQHGRSDSNARHSVLETDALPTELHPYFSQKWRKDVPFFLILQAPKPHRGYIFAILLSVSGNYLSSGQINCKQKSP